MNDGLHPSRVVLGGLVLGLLLGFVYTWLYVPVPAKAISAAELQSTDRERYRLLIALAYAASGDRAQAEARLAALGEDRLPDVLDEQASRASQPAEAQALAQLAAALRAPVSVVTPAASQPTQLVEITQVPANAGPLPTLPPFEPRPSATPDLTSGLRFALSSQDPVCDPALPQGLLQVYVVDEEGGQVAGARVTVTWAGGQTDTFYTGLAPEMGAGYADFRMTPQVSYTLTVGEAGELASGLVAPVCQNADGTSYMGGIRTRFRP